MHFQNHPCLMPPISIFPPQPRTRPICAILSRLLIKAATKPDIRRDKNHQSVLFSDWLDDKQPQFICLHPTLIRQEVQGSS